MINQNVLILKSKNIIQSELRFWMYYRNPRSLNFIFCLIQVIHRNEIKKLFSHR